MNKFIKFNYIRNNIGCISEENNCKTINNLIVPAKLPEKPMSYPYFYGLPPVDKKYFEDYRLEITMAKDYLFDECFSAKPCSLDKFIIRFCVYQEMIHAIVQNIVDNVTKNSLLKPEYISDIVYFEFNVPYSLPNSHDSIKVPSCVLDIGFDALPFKSFVSGEPMETKNDFLEILNLPNDLIKAIMKKLGVYIIVLPMVCEKLNSLILQMAAHPAEFWIYHSHVPSSKMRKSVRINVEELNGSYTELSLLQYKKNYLKEQFITKHNEQYLASVSAKSRRLLNKNLEIPYDSFDNAIEVLQRKCVAHQDYVTNLFKNAPRLEELYLIFKDIYTTNRTSSFMSKFDLSKLVHDICDSNENRHLNQKIRIIRSHFKECMGSI